MCGGHLWWCYIQLEIAPWAAFVISIVMGFFAGCRFSKEILGRHGHRYHLMFLWKSAMSCHFGVFEKVFSLPNQVLKAAWSCQIMCPFQMLGYSRNKKKGVLMKLSIEITRISPSLGIQSPPEVMNPIFLAEEVIEQPNPYLRIWRLMPRACHFGMSFFHGHLPPPRWSQGAARVYRGRFLTALS